jgi:hypothetical protein
MIIEGAESIYDRIAESIKKSILEPWTNAWIFVACYSEHNFYYAKYVPANGNPSQSYEINMEGAMAFVKLRKLFLQAGKPLWCQARFEVQSDGIFKMHFDYENCDKNGYARFDEDEHRELVKRLTAL